tara:strand:+ start:123 stop:608 length:486 start_codon:yes stop_codon:yes gene_type:complete
MTRKKVKSKKNIEKSIDYTKSNKASNAKIAELAKKIEDKALKYKSEKLAKELIKKEKRQEKKRRLEAFKAKKTNPIIRKVDNLISALNPKHYFPDGIGKTIDFDTPKTKKFIKYGLGIGGICVFLAFIFFVGLVLTGRMFISNSKLVVRLPFKIPFVEGSE